MANEKPGLRWTYPDGGVLTFTGEFGEGYASHPSSAPWEPRPVRVGPREEWDELPVRGNPWPEPEADYEALGYPETRVYMDDLDVVAHWERACQPLIMPRAVEFVGDGPNPDWWASIKINQDDVD